MNLRNALLCLMCTCAFLCMPALLKRMTMGFHVRNIQIDLTTAALQSFSPPPSEEIYPLLNQSFSYLGKGAQAYVFQSQDKNLVLKLFRTFPEESAFQKWWRPLFHRTYRNTSSRKEKQLKILRAAEIAFHLAREETGLLYVHLCPTNHQCPQITLHDRLGRRYTMDLDHYFFALQKKAVPIETIVTEQLSTHDTARFHRCMDSLVRLFYQRAALGIHNSDLKITGNIGFLGDQAIELDFANYTLGSPSTKEIGLHITSLQEWLQTHAPLFEGKELLQ